MLAGELAAVRAGAARREEAAATRREERAEAERRDSARELEAWRATHAELAAYLTAGDDGTWPAFLADMAEIAATRPLTGGQATAATRIMRETRERAAREAAAPPPAPVPTGAGIEITGEIVHIRSEPSRYAYNRYETRMLVAGPGWKVWAAVPAALGRETDGTSRAGWIWRLKGQRVRFTADVEASQDDPTFGYAKRPRKARIVTATA